MKHVSDDELLLDYYGEASPDRRAEIRAHLETCAECRALDRELRGVLALVGTEPLPDAPPNFEREMWARLEPHVRGNVVSGFSRTDDIRTKFWSFEFPRWGLAASAAALAMVSFLLGRAWAPPAPPTASLALNESGSLSERLLRTEVEEHLERSQRVLMELVNADDSSPVVLASDRQRATDLVAAGRLYRHSLEEGGDASTRELLEDIERVLVEIANGPEGESSKDLTEVRARITDQDLIFRLRVMTTTMRARERRAAPTW